MFHGREQGDLMGDAAVNLIYIQAHLFRETVVKENVLGFVSVMHIFIGKICIHLSHKMKINFL